jgi:hypothetical protein
MNISTLFYYFTEVSEGNFETPVLLEDVSLTSFPDVDNYLNLAEVNLRDSIIQEILLKIKS